MVGAHRLAKACGELEGACAAGGPDALPAALRQRLDELDSGLDRT